jgi:YidC/Oxa1 family membrane protein insertase
MYIAKGLQTILQPLIDASDAILKFWHGALGSWGWAIVFMTFTIRLVILPLTFKGVKSMQALQVLQPEMKRIQERYKDDKQRQQQELMAFYREHGVNPLGSCLPLLLQIPFFMALFYLLRSSAFKADLGDDKSFLFIPDLAAKLTQHPNTPVVLVVLVVLYITTQLISTMVSTISADPNQRRLMLALPFFFTIFVVNFPAGLMVYWITTNTWTIGQQLLVRKLYPKPEPMAPKEDGDARPARGKPAPAGAAAAVDGKEAKEAKPVKPAKRRKPAEARSDDGNGRTSKPPPSPRKKRKRSGRRR